MTRELQNLFMLFLADDTLTLRVLLYQEINTLEYLAAAYINQWKTYDQRAERVQVNDK